MCVLVLGLCGCLPDTTTDAGVPFDFQLQDDLGVMKDLSGVDLAPGCYAFNETTCLAMPCAADYCFNCACKSVYRGCRPVNAKTLDCQKLGCTTKCCRAQNECGDGGLSCLQPGANVTQCQLTVDCGEGRICDNQQCRPRTCAEVCPANFECAAGATICSRRSCNVDSDCPQRVCVFGFCYDSLGFCR